MIVSKEQFMRPAEIELLNIFEQIEIQPTYEKSGEIITTENAAEMPLLSLTVHGKSVQDGTPTPENPVQVETVKTANLFNSASSYTKTFTGNSADEYTSVNNVIPGVNDVLSAHADETLTLSADAISDVEKAIYLYTNNPPLTRNTFTVSNAPTRIYLTLNGSATTFTIGSMDRIPATITLSNVQIEIGNQVNPYVPYGSYIGIVCGDTVTPIDLQGHELAGLPDGTGDVLTMARTGVIEGVQNVARLSLRIADMDNSENFPGWRTSGIRAILDVDVDRVFGLDAMISIASASELAKFAVNTRFNNDIIYLPKSTYGLTQTQWQELYQDLTIEFLFKMQNSISYSLPSITPPTPIDNGTVRVVANVTPEIDVEYISNGTRGGAYLLTQCAEDLNALDVRVAELESRIENI